MQKENETFGLHYMLDGYGGPEDRLSDKNALYSMLKNLPSQIGMHPISKPVVVEVGPNNAKDPGGLSGFVLIAESHISFHTFPKRGFVTIDVYTCREELNTQQLTDKFKECFRLTAIDEHELLQRGTKYPTRNQK